MSGDPPSSGAPGDGDVRSVMTAAPLAIFVTDDGAIVLANDHAADLFGAPPWRLVGRQVDGLLADVVACIADITDVEQQLADAERALAVMDDHRRTARNVHDTVIQRLFGNGLTLQALTAALGEPARGKVQSVIDGLNETMEVLRAAIVAIPGGDGGAFR